ncbi:hypothetical protein FRC09_015658 [Ceratobasidium sp. 395]|nr:hypothetical protein FRC09_015658 [Ceratobasidium sp. 395]
MWGYVLANSEPVAYPAIDGIFHGCILTGRPEFGNKWQMWLFAYVIFDSSGTDILVPIPLFALYSWDLSIRTSFGQNFKASKQVVITLNLIIYAPLRNDGTAYFIVIFTVNVVWLVMTFRAAEPLKNINEHFSHLVSVVLISRLTIHLRSEGDKHNSQPWQPARPVPSARGIRHHSNSISGPPDPCGPAVTTYAGQRWARSEKGKGRSCDSTTEGSPPESQTTTLRPSPESTPADLDVEKLADNTRMWRRGSLLRRDSINPGGSGTLTEGERGERPVSWMARMRSRRDTAAAPFNEQAIPEPSSYPQTIASWDTAREAGPSPIEAAALSVRQSLDGYAFNSLERPPAVRLAHDFI